MKVETLPDGSNSRVIGTLTLTDVEHLHVEQSGEDSYRINADDRTFYVLHPAKHRPYVVMRRYYGRRYRGQEPLALVQLTVRKPSQIVCKRLDKHSYGLQVGTERFVFSNPRENGPPLELVDRLPEE